MKTGNRELEAYDSILQNLQVLKEAAGDGEKEAIKAISNTLMALRDCVCDPDEFLTSDIDAYTIVFAS